MYIVANRMNKTLFNILLSISTASVAIILFYSLLPEGLGFSVRIILQILGCSILIFGLLIIQNKYIERKSNLLQKYKENKTEIANLKDTAKYRKEFLGDVSHELKTPIFNIQGYVLTLLDGGINDKHVNIKYLERTEKNINRLISIVDDLGIISQNEAGELNLNYQKIDLVQLALEVLEMLEVKALKSKIKITLTSEKARHYAKADRDRITEVITNLVTNAIRYGKKNGFVKIQIYENKQYIITQVEDNGIGIEKKHINRIFERFYRADKSRSAKLGGTGLGLAIVKHIIDAHNQSITVSSKLNQGSTFTFTLSKTKL